MALESRTKRGKWKREKREEARTGDTKKSSGPTEKSPYLVVCGAELADPSLPFRGEVGEVWLE